MTALHPLRRPVGSGISGPVLHALAKARTATWDRLARDPREAQLTTLRSLCHAARATEFGRAHRLGEVRTHAEFRERVPLRSYADFEPYLLRMRAGQRDVLWPGLVRHFGRSSGTSNTDAGIKVLPISRQQVAMQLRVGFDLVARYVAMTDDRSFTAGYTLACYPPGLVSDEGEVGVTSHPGLISRRLPLLVRHHTLPSRAVRDIEDCETKLTRLAETSLHHDVRALTGTTCWFSLVFDRLLAAARAAGRNVDSVREIWPNLRVLFGGGVRAAPYRPIIDARAGKHLVFIDNYNATEGGIMAATDRDGDDALLVLPHRGVFFEFVARAELGAASPRRVPLWEVEANVDYAVVLTTSSGLFGYLIGDLVRFTSLHPHRFVFAGRTSGVVSLVQELTTSGELERAVQRATVAHPCQIAEFAVGTRVGVDGSSRGRYLFFVEFERCPADLAGFERAIDRELGAINPVYAVHRAGDVAILAPRVIRLAKGGARRFMIEIGHHSLQQKFPRVLDDAKRDLLHRFALW